MRQRLEYALVWLLVKTMGSMPRPVARAMGIAIAPTVYLQHVRLRRVGMLNLSMALPDKSRREHRRISKKEFTSFRRQIAEDCIISIYSRDTASQMVNY